MDLGALVAQYPIALQVLTVAGALYLLYLGCSTLYSSPREFSVDVSRVEPSALRQTVKGVAS